MATISYVVNAVDSASATFQRIAGSVDDLLAQLDDLSHQTAEARVGLEGDKEAQLALDDIDLKLARLAKRVASPNVRVEGLASSRLGLDRLNLQLDKLNHKHVTAHVSVDVDRGGLRGMLFSALGGAGSGGPFAGVGAALGGSPLLSFGGAAAIAALASGLGGIIPLLASATIGFGAFGAAAGPTIFKIDKFLSAKSAKARKEAWQDMDPGQRGLAKSMTDLGHAFLKMTKQLEPATLKVFADVLKAVKPLLGDIGMIALEVTPAIDGLVKQFGKFVKSPDFIRWLSNMAAHAGPAITLIGQGIGKLIGALGNLLIAFENPHMMSAVRGFFDLLAKLINVTGWAITHWVTNVQNGLHSIAHAFDDARRFLAITGHDIAHVWDMLRHDAAATGHDIAAAWDFVRHSAAMTGHDIAHTFDVLRHTLAAIWDTIWRNTVTRVRNGINDVIGWIKTVPGRAVGALFGLGHRLADFARSAFTEMWNAIRNVGGDIWHWLTSWVSRLPGWLKHLLGINSPSSVFYDIGKNMMLGLFHGIKDHASQAKNAWGSAINFSGFGIAPNGPVQQYARKLLQARGWGGQWPAFNSLVMAESGWRWNATNPSSGAYGIPQALPGSKMASAGADWRTSPFTQLRWMMGYIAQRYGNPNNAWAHELGFHWYDRGGWLPTGLSLALNTTGRPERVGGAGGNTYNISIGVLPGGEREAGRRIVEAIKRYEQGAGSRWRT